MKVKIKTPKKNSLDKNYVGSTMQNAVHESYRSNKFCQGLDIKIPFS